MNMNNDYLWDKSAPPDPEIERLERLLGRFAPVRAMPPLPAPEVRWRSVRTLAPLVATAAAVIVMVAITWRTVSRTSPPSPAARTTPTWAVAAVAGQPRIGATTIDPATEGRFTVGDTLVTDPSSRARIDVGDIGEVTVEPNTRIRLVSARAAHHRLALDRGALRAFIWAPPGQFFVETPSATAIDLGCVYTLSVDEDGAGLLSVELGWVGFELNGRESFVTAGASCPTRPRLGPGTPRYDDAAEELKAALDALDFGAAPGLRLRSGQGERSAALRTIFQHARPRDSLSLWHLLARVDASERGDVYTALAARVPAPSGVTRDAIMRLDRGALDRWWTALGLGDATFWRKWKGNPF